MFSGAHVSMANKGHNIIMMYTIILHITDYKSGIYSSDELSTILKLLFGEKEPFYSRCKPIYSYIFYERYKRALLTAAIFPCIISVKI